jgi:hypothetical protein
VEVQEGDYRKVLQLRVMVKPSPPAVA